MGLELAEQFGWELPDVTLPHGRGHGPHWDVESL